MKWLFRENAARFTLLYCSGGELTANGSRLLALFEPFCNCSRTERLNFVMTQKQPSLFFFRQQTALIQPRSQNVICLRLGSCRANEDLFISMDQYGLSIVES